MKGKELGESRSNRRSLLWVVMASWLTLTGCARFGPILLNKAVIQYDRTVLESEQQLLLLNIIRLHDDQPPHFTVASDIKATFLLSSNGGVTSAMTRNQGPTRSSPTNAYGPFSLSLGGIVSDSPTITIAPMQGKEFANRLLRPIDVRFVDTIFLQQGGTKIDKLMRLGSRGFLMMSPEVTQELFESKYSGDERVVNYLKSKGCFKDKDERQCFLVNAPPMIAAEDKTERANGHSYELFREVVIHLKAMALSGRLQVFPLNFDIPIEGTFRTTQPLNGTGIKDTIDASEKQYFWDETSRDKEKGFLLAKRYEVTAITDFDFAREVKDKEAFLRRVQRDLELDESLKLGEAVIIVLVQGDQKNHWPIYGLFWLRNFREVLQFLGESLKDQPGYAREYDVAPNRFTEELGAGKVYNPALTLTIMSETIPTVRPRDRIVDVDYKGESFWISSSTGGQRWDKEVFSMLYEIFQFNRVEPAVSPPLISISK